MIIQTEPFALKNFLDNPKYVCCYCACPVDLSYGIVVNKDDIRKYQPEAFDTGILEVKCIKCGSHIQIHFNTKEETYEGT